MTDDIKDIAVIAATYNRAEYQLEKMLHDFRYSDVKKVTKYNHRFEVELTDGTIYKAVVADERMRGLRFSSVFIERGISLEALNNIILCSLGSFESEKITYFE